MPRTALIFGVTLSAAILPAWGQTETVPIGKVLKLIDPVTIEHAVAVLVQAGTDGSRIKLGDPVYSGDVVQTGADGAIGITFSDGTTLNLPSNARMVLNEFVYDPNGKSNSIFLQSQQRHGHLCCRQSRQDGRYEGRHPGWDHGHSMDDSPC